MKAASRLFIALLCASGLAFQARAELPDPAQFGRAMELGDVHAATRWLAEGLPPDFEADTMGSGLMIAAWDGNIPLMQVFLERGANIDHVSRIGEQAIALAAWRGHQKAVEWLLDRGASIDPPDKTWGALHYAAFSGNRRIVDLLLARGAKLDPRAPNLATPLMMPQEALLFETMSSMRMPRPAKRLRPSPAQPVMDPLRTTMELRAPLRVMPLREVAVPRTEKPARSMVTLLVAMTMPCLPAAPKILPVR